jgi:hypothetical protein
VPWEYMKNKVCVGALYPMSHPFLRTKIGCIKDSCAP